MTIRYIDVFTLGGKTPKSGKLLSFVAKKTTGKYCIIYTSLLFLPVLSIVKLRALKVPAFNNNT
jgi:hypothetical protein